MPLVNERMKATAKIAFVHSDPGMLACREALEPLHKLKILAILGSLHTGRQETLCCVRKEHEQRGRAEA
jgi:hypothetical protein